MELEILKLLLIYTKNKKLVDLNFIDRLIEIVVREKNIGNYVRNLKCEELGNIRNDDIIVASYDFVHMDIYVDFKAINALFERIFKDFSNFPILDLILYKNLIITQYILHELEHASQNKKLNDKLDNSFEKNLIKACSIIEEVKNFLNQKRNFFKKNAIRFLNEYIEKQTKIYQMYYEFNPVERLAQINSYKTIVNVLEPLEEMFPRICRLNMVLCLREILQGYQLFSNNKIICPTYYYLLKTGKERIWSDFEFYNKDDKKLLENVNNQFDLEKRMNFGLPISNLEYNKYKSLIR